jgi:hypothetical protein
MPFDVHKAWLWYHGAGAGPAVCQGCEAVAGAADTGRRQAETGTVGVNRATLLLPHYTTLSRRHTHLPPTHTNRQVWVPMGVVSISSGSKAGRSSPPLLSSPSFSLSLFLTVSRLF